VRLMFRRSTMTRFVIIAAFMTASIDQAAAGAKIVTSYDEVATSAGANSTSTTKHLTRTYELELTQNAEVVLSSPDLGASTHRLRDSGFGKTAEGQPFKWFYHVENGSFVVDNEFAGWTLHKTVVTDGKSSCRLTAEYKKKS
jgi:hypothetical protein